MEAESAVLGTILVWPAAWDAAARVIKTKEIFYDIRHQSIWQAMAQLRACGMKVDHVSLVLLLRTAGLLEDCGGVAYVASLPDAAASSDLLDQHVQILIGHYANRRLLAWSAQTLASTEEHPSDKLIASAQSLISEILNHTQANKHTHIKHLATAAMRDIEENYSRQTATIGVPTGFEELDDLTGGFHRSELAVLAARTTVGKTAFAVNVSETAARLASRR